MQELQNVAPKQLLTVTEPARLRAVITPVCEASARNEGQNKAIVKLLKELEDVKGQNK